jgi:cell division protease FtsH
MVYGQKEELIFLGREISEQRDYSESVAKEIDDEVRRLVAEAYERATDLLRQFREQLDAIAHRLIEIETIDHSEFVKIFGEAAPVKTSGTPKPMPVSAN